MLFEYTHADLKTQRGTSFLHINAQTHMHTIKKKCNSISIFKITSEMEVAQCCNCTTITSLKFIILISDVTEHLTASFLTGYFLRCEAP